MVAPQKRRSLAQQVVAVQSISAAGEPYITFDTGAFFVKRGDKWFWSGDFNGGVEDMGYRELYTRWLQVGAFLPMFRSHGTDTPREPWQFGTRHAVLRCDPRLDPSALSTAPFLLLAGR